MHLGGEGGGGILPQKGEKKHNFYELQSEALVYLLPCLFASAFVKRPYQAEKQQNTPTHSQYISVCNWNFVVAYIIHMAKCLFNFPFFNDLFLVIKNLLLSE